MSFRSSRSQESNTSNSTQIGVETKKLWPFEDNCIKLCENFAAQSPFHSCEMSCETHLWHTSAISQPMPPSLQLQTTLQNHLQAANEVANHLHVAESSPSCEITFNLQNKSSNLENGQFNVRNPPMQSQIFATD